MRGRIRKYMKKEKQMGEREHAKENAEIIARTKVLRDCKTEKMRSRMREKMKDRMKGGQSRERYWREHENDV